jgi:hypothetical protein
MITLFEPRQGSPRPSASWGGCKWHRAAGRGR